MHGCVHNSALLTKPLRTQSRGLTFVGGARALDSVNHSWSTSAKVDMATLRTHVG